MASSGAPTKEQRKQCYTARDAYFECLDNANDDIYKCKNPFEIFEKMCPKPWIKHFEQTRLNLKLEQAKRTRGRPTV